MGKETFTYGSLVSSSKVHPRRTLNPGWNYRTLEQVGVRYFHEGCWRQKAGNLGTFGARLSYVRRNSQRERVVHSPNTGAGNSLVKFE